MNKEDLADLKTRHSALLKLCKGGASRNVPISEDKFKTVEDEQGFILACLTNEPRIDFYLKLLGLQEVFSTSAPPPHVDLDAEIYAREYIDKCLGTVKELASEVNLEQFQDAVRERVIDCGTHFSGKLINSDAADAFAVCAGGYNGQPHVSSRTIIAGGHSVPLDQAKLDNTGLYQRIIKVLEKDPIIQEAEVDSTISAAVEAGTKAAFARYGEKQTPFVDHRLRQILLPSGDHYIAVSPLAAGGICALFDRAIANIEQQVATDAAEQEADGAEEGDDSQKTVASRRLYTRLNFPVGGAIVRNVSIHPKGVIQRPVFFDVPVRHPDLRAAWAFVYKPLRLFIPRDQIELYRQYIEGLPDSIRESSAATATIVERAGPIRKIAIGQHQQVMELAANIRETEFRDGDENRPIDEVLLLEKRANPPGSLDLAVVNGHFDQSYAIAMAEAIAMRLYASVILGKEKRPMHQTDRDRIAVAAQKILENML
jgi:hypothetical protein